MRPRNALVLTTGALFGLFTGLSSCMPEEPPADVRPTTPQPVDVVPIPPPEPSATMSLAAQQLAALNSIAGLNERLSSSVRDVRAILIAQDLEARGNLPAATASWFEALGIAQGRFGKLALDGWLKVYTKNLAKKSDKAVLARLIMAETRGGQVSPYMRFRGLVTDAAITPVLATVVPEWLSGEEGGPTIAHGPSAGEKLGPPPAAHGIPPQDPLLIKSATRACAAHKADVEPWQTWIQSLPPPVPIYWSGLLEQICGAAPAAIERLQDAFPKLAESRATQGMAVEAAGRVAALLRANDRRVEAADTYLQLMDLWTKPGVTSAAFGLTPVAFLLRHVDETLWASRYRALVGDYENAKIFAQHGLGMITSAYPMHPDHAAREQLASLKAEAYHALAFRIAVEQHQFNAALSLTLLALDTPDLSHDWQEKLNWYAGLYDYLDGSMASAKKRWDSLLGHTRDDNLKASLLFWLAKASQKLGKKAEAKTYLETLVSDYPLSYYAVVAPVAAGIADGGPPWRSLFGDPERLATNLTQPKGFGLAALRQGRDIGPLLTRAEVLTTAGLGDLARAAVDELEAAMSTELPMDSAIPAYVYLTRLQYASGEYLKAIGVTTKLARTDPEFWRHWPEQILVYFPRPYQDDYERNAQETSLPPELLLGISRQESGFSPEIRSSVNAVGIMQLIHPTGLRFAAELGMDTSNIDETLRNPVANIRIGARYLKFLNMNFKGFEPAVYGGYNAGEYAVDLWLKRRAHSDPLMFVELVPFAETRDYIKNVWRNVIVYKHLAKVAGTPAGLELAPPAKTAKAAPHI